MEIREELSGPAIWPEAGNPRLQHQLAVEERRKETTKEIENKEKIKGKESGDC